MTTPLISTAPIPVFEACAGDVVRYAGEIYRTDRYVPYAVLDGGVLLAYPAVGDGGWCPIQVALPFPNKVTFVELVTGGVA